ncbi:tRNA(m(1)G37)methyltransferase [Acarospora aff. strigata]|nr:tRNA(m(1)G37)methyltransferase [Acarospora aff. strigata]
MGVSTSEILHFKWLLTVAQTKELPPPSFADDMFRPPVNRAMRVLDRSFFKKRIPLAAARVLDNTKISKCRKELERSKELLRLERIAVVRPDPEEGPRASGRKCLLLQATVIPNDTSTWSSTLQDLVANKDLNVLDYKLDLNYDYWTYHDIISSILPEDEQEELPTGFSVVGHIAHLNLRYPYFPYKNLIAEVLLDKNPNVRTVINKIDDVGTTSEFRTFTYEVLAGDPDMNVEVKEEDCIFRFDYSKVYWNSRLNTEHRRLVEMFQPGEAVCDVMAGVGPFAVPAGKREVFVWANDLNPDSYISLKAAVERNKVSQFVHPFNVDGRLFIREAAEQLFSEDKTAVIKTKQSRSPSKGHSSVASSKIRPRSQPSVTVRTLRQPRTFNHYVMNLPATAITFLDAFIGLYRWREQLFSPHTTTKLPMIHVHCFSTKSDDNVDEKRKICTTISERIQFDITPDDPEVEIWDVRDVAPKKRMFCASFRLPAEVAFR